MARHASLAEQYRAHREAFTLALELGCTPKEAEREIARRKREECARRLQAKMAAPLRPGLIETVARPRDDDRDPEPWMMRD